MAQCQTPFGVKDKKTNTTIPVPCGKCPNCRKRRASGWSFRLMVEEKHSRIAHFITLTYDTKHVPITKSGFMDLNSRDVQLFFKRLRKHHEPLRLQCPELPPIKYYCVGEYGGKSYRPHYHIILFNADRSKIQLAWDKGSVHYGQVTGASVGYTLKYISKPGRIPLHKNDDRTPEFSRMSKGLGESYLTPQMLEWHKKDLENRMYCNIEGGKKITMPRYYKDKVYSETERKIVAFYARKKMIDQDKAILEDPEYYEKQYSQFEGAQKRMAYRSTNNDKI